MKYLWVVALTIGMTTVVACGDPYAAPQVILRIFITYKELLISIKANTTVRFLSSARQSNQIPSTLKPITCDYVCDHS